MSNFKVGMIGFDTSHVIRFAKNSKEESPGQVKGINIIAGVPTFSPDLPSSYERVEGYTKELSEKWGVKIVSTIEELISMCDAIILTSLDGRRHLKEVTPILKAKKPVFIDKPFAASYADAKEIVRLSKENNSPMFSSSSLRFDYNFLQVKADKEFGTIMGADAVSPASLEITNPGLFWYGIHGLEALYTFMGRGCSKVFCEKTETTHLATGVWSDGRIGTLRGVRGYACGSGVTLFTEKQSKRVDMSTEVPLFAQLLKAILEFFKTGIPPVEAEETLEMMQFMEAAYISEREERSVYLQELD
ncbi:Gfo/Idh/MocA family oxidoreductase [bacterium]|nr:Gfo/Idh/MocA family oxidoreductase [bacterium]